MPTILLSNLQTLDADSLYILYQLNIASICLSVLLLLLANWFRFYRSHAHVDQLRCRTILALSISMMVYSICQVSTFSGTTSSVGTRVALFASTLSLVTNGLLITGPIALDAAVRYGLRSIGLARNTSKMYELFCIPLAVVVTQSTLYVFGDVVPTKYGVLSNISQMGFDAGVWMTESTWIVICLAVSGASIGYTAVMALVRWHKGRKSTSSSLVIATASCESMESVLGSPASVKYRVIVATLYVVAFYGLYVWKLAFRIMQSPGQWLLYAILVCEAIQPIVFLAIFILDICINIVPQRPIWLSPSTVCSPQQRNGRSSQVSIYALDNKSFTSWRKTGFLEWQLMGNNTNSCVPSDEDLKVWMQELKKAHLNSEVEKGQVSYPSTATSSSVSDVSFADVPGCYSSTMVTNPLTKSQEMRSNDL